MTATDN